MVVLVNLILSPWKRIPGHFFDPGYDLEEILKQLIELNTVTFTMLFILPLLRSALQARLRPSKKWINHGIAKDFLFIRSGVGSACCRRKEKVEKKCLGRNREQVKFWSMLGRSLNWKVMWCAFSYSRSKLELFPPDEWETRPAYWLTFAGVYTVLSQEAWHQSNPPFSLKAHSQGASVSFVNTTFTTTKPVVIV